MDNKVYHTLTHPQKRIWYIEKIYPGTAVHNIGGVVRIKGIIDYSILEEAINIFIKKNEGLRLRIIEVNGEARQYVADFKRTKLDFFDFSTSRGAEDEFNRWIDIECKKVFSLIDSPLHYYALYKINENEGGYFVNLHHIIADGWSVNIMTEKLCDIYMSLLKVEEVNQEIEHSYLECIEQECKYLDSDRFIKNKSFWQEKFSILPDFLVKSVDNIAGKRKSYTVDEDKTKVITEFSAKNKYSLNVFFVAIFLIYLYKITHQNDIVIGTPVLNRTGQKEKSIFGMFTSTMPFRLSIDDQYTALGLMEKVKQELMSCYFNQKYPYDFLVQDLELKKKGYNSLFDICINYYATKLHKELNGSPIENIEFYNGNQIYSLQLIIREWSNSGNLILDFDYKVDAYTDSQIGDMYGRLNSLIDQVLLNPGKKISNLSTLFEDEKHSLIYDFNSTQKGYPIDRTIYQLFEGQVEKTPDKAAICFEGKELTYRELNEKSNQLARFLVEKGVERKSIVGLLNAHSLETVIGILGIIKAGGAYLPIDPQYPSDRINYMLNDSNVKILLTNVGNEYIHGNENTCPIETINLNAQYLYKGDISSLGCVNTPKDLVYIIYTSGSTGKPKGTMITHQGLVNYIWWAKHMYVKDDNEVFALYSSLAFDLTVTSIFTPLVSGAKIIVYRNDRDEYVLHRIMKENKATIVKLTPSHLSLLKDMDNRYSSVKRFIVGGEDLKVNLARSVYESFGGDIEIYNEYGPTETVVGCMIHRYDYENNTGVSVPIGIPADNVQIYVLDKNLNPVPCDGIGEIYISGDGVARGYLNREDLTRERFIENPYIKGSKMYKTGDLAKFLSSRIIEYTGRADYQVKLRGYRIELGEIEKQLLVYSNIKDAVVIDRGDKNKYLCAYIVEREKVSLNELRVYLSSHLPGYMIPACFVVLDRIPLTANGKVNRELLPEPEKLKGLDFVAFNNEREEKLVNAIKEILGVEAVSMNDNFYYLGGDSIKAIQIASQLSDSGLKIKVRDILSHPIIGEMALFVAEGDSAVEQSVCEGSIKPTPITSWFFSQNFNNLSHYNQSVLLGLKQDIDQEKLERILSQLIKHHDSLRLNYNSKTQELYYNNTYLQTRYKVEVYDLSGYPYLVQKDRMVQICEKVKSDLNIENDILFKSVFFNLGNGGKRLLLTANHLVVDGVSWRIILEDVYNMVKQINLNKEILLPHKTHSLQLWGKVLEDYSKNESLRRLDYWRSVISRKTAFPSELNMGEDIVQSGRTISEQLGEEETSHLLTGANLAYNTEPKDLLITALALTLKEFTNSNELTIELEGHGREDMFEGIDVARTVGWFTSIYPVNIKIDDYELSGQIRSIKEQLRRIPDNGLSFGILKYLSKSIYDNELKYTRFNFLGDFSSVYENDIFVISHEESGSECSKNNHLTSLIDINAMVIDKRLIITLTYSSNKYKQHTMTGFMTQYIIQLSNIISHCRNKEKSEFTPSDFDTVELLQEELDGLFT